MRSLQLTGPEYLKQSIALVEAFYWRKERLPESNEEVEREFMQHCDLESVLTNHKAVAYLREQGVPVGTEAAITPKQLRWIKKLLDSNDHNPWVLKLRNEQITQAQHDAWMQNPLFKALLRERADKLLETEKAQILSALNKRAQGGDIRAVRLALELTGDLNVGGGVPKHEVAGIMRGILEILQMHVDRATLIEIQDDFEYLLTHGIVRHRLRPVAGQHYNELNAQTTLESFIESA